MAWVASDLERTRSEFWKRVHVETNEQTCWLWSLSNGSHGYGQWWPAAGSGHPIFDRNWLTHRMTWFLIYGPIPPGWTIDHRCRVRRCCNPKHLRLRTCSDNCSDNGWSGRGECKNGHRLDADNVAFYRGNRGRVCKQCRRARR